MKPLAHSYSSIKMYQNCPKRFYEERINKSVKDEGGAASIYGERVHKQLEDHIKKGAPLPRETQHMAPVLEAITSTGAVIKAEQEFTLNVKLEPTSWFAKDAWHRVKVDVLGLPRPDRAVVLDWKTGKRKPDFMQLDHTAIHVFINYPDVEVMRASFIWMKDNQSDAEIYRRSQLPNLIADLHAKTTEIEEAYEIGDFPPRPSGLCGYCPVRSCKFHR